MNADLACAFCGEPIDLAAIYWKLICRVPLAGGARKYFDSLRCLDLETRP